ncbi:hypothetical protein [Pendulispora albinea]|uniref:MBL fold metallo-hydrolase n=1 Tax=Pendulispora albinea TaxID=2741071 RepID=A0ABZ2LQH5_9BACT
MKEPRADRALVIDPAWLVFMGSYRLHNGISTTWHYLSAGPEVEKIGAVFKEMSRRRRAGRTDWFFDEARRLFEWRGEELRLKDEHYWRAATSLFDEDDLALVFAAREGTTKVGLAIGPEQLRALGELLPRLRPTRSAAELEGREGLLETVELLRSREIVTEIPRAPRAPRATDYGLRLTGHGGVLVETPRTRALIDPLLTLRYRPEVDRLHELDAPLDAIVITQSRWSHFALDTLLHVDRATPIYLARKEHPPSLDNLDMYSLLRELGFETLRSLTTWETESIGDIRLTAMPFQGAGLGTDSPVDWMTLHVAAGGRRAFLATSACADQRGSFDGVVREMVERLGTVDFVFASYEDYHYPVSWFTRRPFYLGPGREQATTSPDDAVRWTSLAGAHYLIPYASFVWSERDLGRSPTREVLYAGVVQRGSFARLASQMAEWPLGPMIRLLPGGELRWRDRSELRVRHAPPSSFTHVRAYS